MGNLISKLGGSSESRPAPQTEAVGHDVTIPLIRRAPVLETSRQLKRKRSSTTIIWSQWSVKEASESDAERNERFFTSKNIFSNSAPLFLLHFGTR